MDLRKEAERQRYNDDLRREYAENANTFHAWLIGTRSDMVDCQGDLEDQLAVIQDKSKEIADHKDDLSVVEDLGAQM